jgi:2-amino-4-hydroxy-6-hydroxymethyldihydropteridine diphosphokinase
MAWRWSCPQNDRGGKARRFSIAIAYVGVGSNVGDRQAWIREALALLQRNRKVEILQLSSLYETQPVGVRDQPMFLNAVVKISTGHTPRNLVRLFQTIERRLGRRRTIRWGPRRIDLDLLLYDHQLVNQPEVVVPHPELAKRAFVLVPMVEIAPDVVHPLLGKTMSQLLACVGGAEAVWRYQPGGNTEHD